jgi:putative ABC transport system permease protein
VNIPNPPEKAIQFLEWFCPPALAEGILGDLYEAFDQDVIHFGERKARQRFIWNVIRFMRPGIILRNRASFTLFNNNMWSNYLKIAGRNLLKRKLYSFINSVGLSIGISFCILIFLFIRDEKSFDTFHENKDSIYRVESKSYETWEPNPDEIYNYSAWLQSGLRDAVLEDISSVVYATQYNPYGEVAVRYGDKVFSESLTFVHDDFFNMFSFATISGDRSNFLKERHEVVLPLSTSNRIFGSEDPLGKTITITIDGEKKDMIVAGVIEDTPHNSSLEYGILSEVHNKPRYEDNLDRWNNFNSPLFIQVKENVTAAEVKEQLASIVTKYMPDSEKQRELHAIPEDMTVFEYQLTNMGDVHMNTQISWNRSSDPMYAYILGAIALLILGIACINYISLALTSSAGRSVEVGIRKSIGANRFQLLTQFTVEAILLAFFSLILAIALASVFLPSFNTFTNKNIELTLETYLYMGVIGLGITLFIGLLSGSYPSIYLSGLNPTKVLKRIGTRVNAGFTKPLVVIQYALSGVLIISSLIMMKQMDFITT